MHRGHFLPLADYLQSTTIVPTPTVLSTTSVDVGPVVMTQTRTLPVATVMYVVCPPNCTVLHPSKADLTCSTVLAAFVPRIPLRLRLLSLLRLRLRVLPLLLLRVLPRTNAR
jgi:hypothetical protein